ncbi:hypothetical protein [Phytohabitans rumicis]|uniref:hypothetical protein n=1 Tax=Phytohabitans rumicis TaxID=1076125 RepID=UPI0031ECEB37
MNPLRHRQAALQTEADELLAGLDLTTLVADIGAPLLTGSYVSGLMCWRDLDVMLLVGPGFTPGDALGLLRRFVDHPGVVGFDYRDERGTRSPTGTARDERYHLVISVDHAGETWRLDLTLWLNDPHTNVTEWHEALRDRITDEETDAVLAIKDVWHRLPTYPDEVGGLDIYTAVLDAGVRTPDQFATWLNTRP